jgi:hypothetical protein
MEELVLTDPIVVPEKVTNKYRVVSFTMNMELIVSPVTGDEPGFINIQLKDNNNEPLTHNYYGTQAVNLIKTLNTANLTTKSMHKRILEKLANDGVIPGTVTGTPDPIAGAVTTGTRNSARVMYAPAIT